MEIAKQIYRPWEQTNPHRLITNNTLTTKWGTKWIICRESNTNKTAFSELLLDKNSEITVVHESCKNIDHRIWKSDFDINYMEHSSIDNEKYNEISN